MYVIPMRKIEYSKTRRGMNATAPIYCDGKQIGTIYDEAEKIVTPVTFNTPADKATFLAAARESGIVSADMLRLDDYAISGYARTLLADAETKLLALGDKA